MKPKKTIKKIKDNHSYYHFNADLTIGYVSRQKMERMIANWGWKKENFVIDTEIYKLIPYDQ